jgi:hypothetical protein
MSFGVEVGRAGRLVFVGGSARPEVGVAVEVGVGEKVGVEEGKASGRGASVAGIGVSVGGTGV